MTTTAYSEPTVFTVPEWPLYFPALMITLSPEATKVLPR